MLLTDVRYVSSHKSQLWMPPKFWKLVKAFLRKLISMAVGFLWHWGPLKSQRVSFTDRSDRQQSVLQPFPCKPNSKAKIAINSLNYQQNIFMSSKLQQFDVIELRSWVIEYEVNWAAGLVKLCGLWPAKFQSSGPCLSASDHLCL